MLHVSYITIKLKEEETTKNYNGIDKTEEEPARLFVTEGTGCLDWRKCDFRGSNKIFHT